MTNLVRLLASLVLLFMTTGVFASVVEPGSSNNQFQIAVAEQTIAPESSPFSLPSKYSLLASAFQLDLIVKPHADGTPSFQFEPVIGINLVGGEGFLESEFFEGRGGLYYYNARFYDPTLGRFITEDPARSGDNWEIYALDNPLRFVDPTGLEILQVPGRMPVFVASYSGENNAGGAATGLVASYPETAVFGPAPDGTYHLDTDTKHVSAPFVSGGAYDPSIKGVAAPLPPGSYTGKWSPVTDSSNSQLSDANHGGPTIGYVRGLRSDGAGLHQAKGPTVGGVESALTQDCIGITATNQGSREANNLATQDNYDALIADAGLPPPMVMLPGQSISVAVLVRPSKNDAKPTQDANSASGGN